MKAIDDVIAEVSPTLNSIESLRLEYLQKRKTCIWTVMVPLGIVSLICALAFFPFGLFAVVLSAIACGIAYHFMAGKRGKAYVNSYKTTVVSKLVNLVDENLSYDAERGIDSGYFVQSELFPTNPDRYHTEDLIHGNYGKTSLMLGELHAEERYTTTDSKGNTETKYRTIFRGLLLIADFHKHFNGRTFLFPDFAEKTFGGFGRALQKMGGRSGTELVQMEDPDFEKAFAVHSSDQVEARYILSPAMMRRFLDLRKKFGEDVRVAFKQSSVWIAVPHGSSFLEPSTKVSATNSTQIEKMLFELSSFLEIVEELDLNTRIWTKE